MSADEVRAAHLEPVADVGHRLAEELERIGPNAPVRCCQKGR